MKRPVCSSASSTTLKAACLMAALCLAGCSDSSDNAPAAISPGSPGTEVHAADMQKHMDEIARESNGDYTKLSPQDQRLVDGITGGHGPQVIMMRAQQLLELDAKRALAAERAAKRHDRK